MQSEQPDTKTVYWVTDLEYFRKLNRGLEPHQGWSNSATWCFHLYFFQEPRNCEDFEALRRQDGGFNLGRVCKLFNRAQHGGRMSKVDSWCEGRVNVWEILEYEIRERWGDEGLARALKSTR